MSDTASRFDRLAQMGMMVVAGIFLASIFFSIAVNSISLGLLGILWVSLLIARRTWKDLATPLDWFFLAYVIAELLSSALSVNPSQSFFNARRLLLIGIVYFFAVNLATGRELRRYFWILEGAAIAVGCVGVAKLLLGPSGADAR